jgi:hypothetical protein
LDAWCRRRAGLYHCCLGHLEYLIRHAGVTRQASAELADIAFRTAPAVPNDQADREASAVQSLEERNRVGDPRRRVEIGGGLIAHQDVGRRRQRQGCSVIPRGMRDHASRGLRLPPDS